MSGVLVRMVKYHLKLYNPRQMLPRIEETIITKYLTVGGTSDRAKQNAIKKQIAEYFRVSRSVSKNNS